MLGGVSGPLGPTLAVFREREGEPESSWLAEFLLASASASGRRSEPKNGSSASRGEEWRLLGGLRVNAPQIDPRSLRRERTVSGDFRPSRRAMTARRSLRGERNALVGPR